MSAKPTPGPWSVEDPMDFELSIVEAGKPTHEWQFIATVPLTDAHEYGFSRSVAEANARLIASSPILFDFVAKKAAEGDQDAARIISLI